MAKRSLKRTKSDLEGAVEVVDECGAAQSPQSPVSSPVEKVRFASDARAGDASLPDESGDDPGEDVTDVSGDASAPVERKSRRKARPIVGEKAVGKYPDDLSGVARSDKSPRQAKDVSVSPPLYWWILRSR